MEIGAALPQVEENIGNWQVSLCVSKRINELYASVLPDATARSALVSGF